MKKAKKARSPLAVDTPDEFRLVVSRYVSRHKSEAESRAALRKYRLVKGEIAVVVKKPKGGWND